MRNIYPGASRGYQPYPHPHNSINGINRYPQVRLPYGAQDASEISLLSIPAASHAHRYARRECRTRLDNVGMLNNINKSSRVLLLRRNKASSPVTNVEYLSMWLFLRLGSSPETLAILFIRIIWIYAANERIAK